MGGEVMGTGKQLSRQQRAVIEDLFAGESDEQAVLDKHGVSRNLFNKWLADERFARQFEERIAGAYRQSEIILARYAPLAAAKLVELTASENQETARKACLDIISLRTIRSSVPDARCSNTSDEQPTQGVPELSDETASRLLAVLAGVSTPED
jgi:hypothetical protein